MPLPYEDDLKQLIGGQVCHAGLSQEGYPYLIIAKNAESRPNAEDAGS